MRFRLQCQCLKRRITSIKRAEERFEAVASNWNGVFQLLRRRRASGAAGSKCTVSATITLQVHFRKSKNKKEKKNTLDDLRVEF